MAASPPPFRVLPGELLVVTAPNVVHDCHYDGHVHGTLYLTTFKLVFQSLADGSGARKVFHDWKGNVYTAFRYSDKPGPEVPLTMISRVEKVGNASNKREAGYGLELYCNDFRTLRFLFQPENHARRPFFDSLMRLAFPLSDEGGIGAMFAFSNKETFEGGPNGWEIFDLRSELARQRVPFDASAGNSWRITEINRDYSLCETYPQLLAVPASISDERLRSVAQFRTKGRLPILVWVHPVHKVALTRCSQPKVGMWRRNSDDETFLRALHGSTVSGTTKLFIIDARPKANAYANQMMNGAGFESTGVYEGTELVFMNIDNIHVMRESLRSLREHCFPNVTETNWYSKIEATKWLDHLRLVLTAAVQIVELMDMKGIPCLVHCSDGWDRTAQLTSLATMMMDPYYRRMKGFAVLVEKEWVHAGHQFALRTGQGSKNHGDDQRAPIFLQFLDCVHQLLRQFPTAFEFNNFFLVTLADELFSARFGTFLCNYDKQRAEAKKKSPSIWNFMLAPSNYQVFANPCFVETPEVILPFPSLRRLHVWTEYYARWTPQLAREDEAQLRQWQLQTFIRNMAAKAQEQQGHTSQSTSPILTSSPTVAS